jgi:predicted HAD superfamily hydrolase
MLKKRKLLDLSRYFSNNLASSSYKLVKKIKNSIRNLYLLQKKITYKHTITSLLDLLPTCETFQIISFDFFDTIVHRIIAPPNAVKLKTAEYACLRLKKLGYCLNTNEFNLIRDSKENKLRDVNFYYEGKDRETDIYSIITHTLLHITQKKLNRLIQDIVAYEVKNEIKHLYLNKDIKKLLLQLKAKGKKIIVCSDMYLAEAHIKQIAEHFDIASYIEKFYVSSTKKINKGSGRLYHYILQDLQISAKMLLHIGDNLHSDYLSPKKLSIPAIFYYNKFILKKYKKITRLLYQLNHSKKNLNDTLITQFIKKKNKTTNDYTKISSHIAPAITSFAYQALLDMHRRGIKKVFFFTREGILLKKIFSLISRNVLLFQDTKKEFEFKLLHISRLSSTCANYYNTNTIEPLIESCQYATASLSLFNFIATLGLSLQDFSTKAQETIKAYPHSLDPQTLINLFNTTRFGQEFDALLKQKAYYLKRYLLEQGVISEGKIGLVDLGWGGTIQRNISHFLSDQANTEFFGYYFGTNDLINTKANPIPERSTFLPGYILSHQSQYQTEKLIGAAPFLESVCGYDTLGTTIAYTENKQGDVIPRLDYNEKKNSYNSIFQQHIQKYLLIHSKEFSQLFNIAYIPIEKLKAYATIKFSQFIFKPNKINLKKLCNYHFNYNWSANTVKPLITIINYFDLVKPIALLRKIQKSPWRYGSMATAPIPFLFVLYNLGHQLNIYFPRLKSKVRAILNKKSFFAYHAKAKLTDLNFKKNKDKINPTGTKGCQT